MPTWLVHGFRWPRPSIRIHVILHNLDDATPDWLMAPATSSALLANFQALYPKPMAALPDLRFIEQYDPEDLVSKDQPHAFVCDQVHEVGLSLEIDEVRGKGVANEAWGALADLRDQVAKDQKVGWFVVFNGDVERYAPEIEDDEGEYNEYEEEEAEEEEGTITGSTSAEGSLWSPVSMKSGGTRQSEEDDYEVQTPAFKGIKNWFSKQAKKTRSSKSLRDLAMRSEPSPPLPPMPSSDYDSATAASKTASVFPKRATRRNARIALSTRVKQ